MLPLCKFVLSKRDMMIKKHNNLVTLILSLVVIAFILTTYSSCRFFNNTIPEVNIKQITDTEEQQIARFLVKITNINFKIIELSQYAQEENISSDINNFFNIQENKITEIQKKISKIAINKLVTLPQYNVNSNTLYYFNTSGMNLTGKLTEELNKEIVLFEKIKIQTKDREITSFHTKYLLEIKAILEETSTFNVQLYNIN